MSGRDRLSLAAVVAVVLAFYTWTTVTSLAPGLPDRPATSTSLASTDRPVDPSNRFVEAIEHGRLNLDLPVPEGLRTAKRVRDPEDRGALSSDYLDLAYHDGRLYSFWGPVPVLTLLLPVHQLGLGYMSQALAVLLYASASFLLLVAVLRLLVRRFFPRLPHWAFLLGVAAVGVCDLAPYLLRRPEVYELALAAGLCFAAGALLCFLSWLLAERPRVWQLVAGSVLAGLALGSRLPAGMVVIVGLVAVIWRARTDPEMRVGRVVGHVAAAMGPLLLFVAAYAAYNEARFGSPTDIGVTRQLVSSPKFGGKIVRGSSLPPGLWYYVMAPPRLRLQFPFFWLPPGPTAPVPTPSSYGAVEPTGGVLPTLPIVAMLAVAPFVLRERARRLGITVAALVAFGIALVLFLAFYIDTASMRYEADYRAPLLLAALLVWFGALSWTRSRRRRRWVKRGGVVLLAWGLLVTVMISFVGEKNRLATASPDTYSALNRLFSRLPTITSQVVGHPMVVAVDGNVGLPPWGYDRVSLDGTGFDVGLQPVTLQVVSPSSGVFRFRARVSRTPGSGVREKLLLGVSANGTGQYEAVGAGAGEFPIRLVTGTNDVRVEAGVVAARRSPAADARLVRLEQVRVR